MKSLLRLMWCVPLLLLWPWVVRAGGGTGVSGDEELPTATAVAQLEAVPLALSAARGGVQSLFLDAGVAHAGESYLLLGSASDSEGAESIALGPHQLPLARDPYLLSTLHAPGAGALRAARGQLDAAGRARAEFVLPPGAALGLVGLELRHAFVVVDPHTGQLRCASEAAPLRILP